MVFPAVLALAANRDYTRAAMYAPILIYVVLSFSSFYEAAVTSFFSIAAAPVSCMAGAVLVLISRSRLERSEKA